jgi:hypothetical protein
MTLSREEILAMEPGRLLDAEIAEKVMGWHTFSPIDTTCDHAVGAGGYRRNFAFDPADDKQKVIPFYSRDISAAWEVVEKLKYEVTVKKYEAMSGYRYWARVNGADPNQFDEKIANCSTASEAICKAALLAVLDL